VLPAVALCCGAVGVVVAGEAFTIVDAINMAVTSNPGVGEAAANRRATEAELRQSQGVLLPQVATEHDLGPEAFLAAACRKAGLGPDAWREPGTHVFTFQADVFGE